MSSAVNFFSSIYREVDYYGNFVKHTNFGRKNTSNTYKSALDGEKEYELTELGQQFVHCNINEKVPRIASESTTI